MRMIHSPFPKDKAVPFSTIRDCRCVHNGWNLVPISCVNESAEVEGMAIRVEVGGAAGCSFTWDAGDVVATYVVEGVCESVKILVDLRRDALELGSREDVSTKSR